MRLSTTMRHHAAPLHLEAKGQSPFSPGRPVGPELFVGRQEEILSILRAAHQVALGKQENVFITGEYGIGKSSLAGCARALAEEQYQLAGFHVHLSGATTIEQMMEQVIARITRDAHATGALGSLRGLFAKYVKDVSLLGVKLDVAAPKRSTSVYLQEALDFDPMESFTW